MMYPTKIVLIGQMKNGLFQPFFEVIRYFEKPSNVCVYALFRRSTFLSSRLNLGEAF